MKSIIVPVIVTYNLDFKKFFKLNGLSNNVIFSDNSLMKSDDERVRRFNLIRNKVNLGYGGGANLGIRQALKSGAEWVIIMNQDLLITKDAYEQFIDKLKKTDAAIVGPFGGGFDIRRWTTILPSEQIDYISGAFMAIHRDVIDKIGYFYEPYFMYYEDADYCVRAKKAGFPLLKREIKGIVHHNNPSLGKGSSLHEYYLARNHLLFVEREAPLSVKVREYVRLPKTLVEYSIAKNYGGLEGIKDYLLRKFHKKL
jgi:GT2 family glycosyltransferase